jgi:Holliday junction resolvase
MGNYTRGRAREYRVKKELFEEGALWVVRSYGSHGLFDLTAVFPDHVRLIQVKKDYIHPKERKALEEFAERVQAQNISVEVWFTSPRLRVLRLGG